MYYLFYVILQIGLLLVPGVHFYDESEETLSMEVSKCKFSCRIKAFQHVFFCGKHARRSQIMKKSPVMDVMKKNLSHPDSNRRPLGKETTRRDHWATSNAYCIICWIIFFSFFSFT